ncbi:MAG TPA: D-arabinono-1,4-lactone oxidase [Caulobacteraceae bacterium]
MPEWRNWSGSVACEPAEIAAPKTLAELQGLVARAAKVRVAGTGHSFMPLCATDGLLLSLSDLEGEIEVAADGASAWVPAGWAIGKLTAALWGLGYSLINQGDIDKQAIAGAVCTATHGTGRTLGSLATAAEAFELVLADGTLIQCDRGREPELFEAARLSLGMLGVVTRIRMRVLPAYRLKETIRRRPLKEMLSEWDALAAEHRHVEFFHFPYSEHCSMKTLDVVAEGESPDPGEFEDTVFQAVCDLAAAWPRSAATMQRLMTRAMGQSERAGPAGKIFPSERTVRFEEMEYEIPAANGAEALRTAMALVRDKRWPIIFPFEYRAVAGDDIWLSPMQGRECVSISFHQYAKMPWREAFAGVEKVFQDAGGRPHWAKRHTLSAADVVRLYPDAERWGAVRKRFDPAAKFLNGHLAEVFAFSL